jgi:diguanylate cyclase (GGDEF)-like protein
MDTVHPVDAVEPGWGRGAGDVPARLSASSLTDSVLSHITHLLVSEGSQEKVLEAVADALRALVPHDTLSLYEADPPIRLLRPVMVRDRYTAEILAMGPTPYGIGITGSAAESGMPQLVPDTRLDPRARHIAGTPEGEPESMMVIPLMARGELKGVLCLYREGEGNVFSDEEFALAIGFGELAALSIDNAQIRAGLEIGVITDGLTAMYNHRYFHERLGEELRRANRSRTAVSLVLYDIDDFKRVNDTYGHLVGDQVLQGLATISRETCRAEDVLCRVGGEEFGLILPGARLAEAEVVAERLRASISRTPFPGVDDLTVSLGVAEGPLHASSPRELATCADLALLEAKAAGKDRVCTYVLGRTRGNGSSPRGHLSFPASASSGLSARLTSMAARGEQRPVAQLRVLQSLSAKLNRLNDVGAIGKAITAELRSLIDYHNCRVHLVQADGVTLAPIAFRGELSEYQGETFEGLVMQVGEGIAGRVAETGRSYYTPNANDDPVGVPIPGTPDVDESILTVPMAIGDRVIGTVALSKLGVDQFDDEDMRLLEALASNAAIAFENARLLEMEREAAHTSHALLRLSQALTKSGDTEDVLDEALEAIPSMIDAVEVQAWIREQDGSFRLVRHRGFEERLASRLADHRIPGDVARRFLASVEHPFVLPVDVVATVPPEYLVLDEVRPVLVAPLRWEPDGLGVIAVLGSSARAQFTERHLGLARGIADITSLALGNARRFDDLEHAYVSTVEALANALEAQDEYTEDHCRALAEMSMAVGAALGLEGERLKILELGALFHDIGKIGVRSEVIRKPSPLTAAEQREMSRHTIIGERILAPVPFLQPVRPIVRWSHERWDGKGYPDGLAHEEIPLESRIVFVCDAFHAMTTDRPYRPALPPKEAIRRLKLSSGTQFDPRVVDVFVRLHAAGEIHFG